MKSNYPTSFRLRQLTLDELKTSCLRATCLKGELSGSYRVYNRNMHTVMYRISMDTMQCRKRVLHTVRYYIMYGMHERYVVSLFKLALAITFVR